MGLDVPIVLIIFRRPNETRQVFEAIRRAQPQRLYIVGDSAREGNAAEAEAVETCRSIVRDVDWDCEIFTDYPTENLGLRQRVVSGLDWVFSIEQRAIILEDDCVPVDSFFDLTSYLLYHYAEDERVGGIGGTNIGTKLPGEGNSYFFSRYPVIWGWATWRRVWLEYRSDIPTPSKSLLAKYKGFSPSSSTSSYWRSKFQGVSSRRIDTWDYQLAYLSMIKDYLWVVPAKNLVANIGFGAAATHTWDAKSPYSRLSTGDIVKPYVHPAKIEPNDRFDQWLRETMHKESSLHRFATRVMNSLPERIRSLVLRMVLKRRGGASIE